MRCLSVALTAMTVVISVPFANERAAGQSVEATLRPGANSTNSQAAAAGIVAVLDGYAFAQKGEIHYARARVGQELRVNEFGQYRDSKPTPAYVRWMQNTQRQLKTGDAINEGDILTTTGDAYLKVLFSDDSILDVGPASVVQVQKFQVKGDDRNVYLKTLYGRIRSVVAKELRGPQQYQIATPSVVMGVRGTEFLVNVVPDEKGVTQTEVLCLHGQVSVDVAKHTTKGLVYNQPIVVNPGSAFSTAGVHGLGQEVSIRPLSQQDLRVAVARVSPQVNAFATVVGATPGPTRLPGTGLAMRVNGKDEPKRQAPKTYNSFDADHPLPKRQIASPSGNFSNPHDFQNDPGAFGGLRDLRRYTGPAPISLLPGNTARVGINLNGI